jgi:hypothetical protein
MRTSSGNYDAKKLTVVKGQLRRAYRNISTLLEGMTAVEIEALEISGDAELQRGLNGVLAFGENGHAALRKEILSSGKATPDAADLPPEKHSEVGGSGKKKKPQINGTR